MSLELPVCTFLPADGTINLGVDQEIYCSVVDPSTTTPGITLASVNIFVRRGENAAETVFTAGAFDADWLPGSSSSVITGPPPGYLFTLGYDYDYQEDQSIVVTVKAVTTGGRVSYTTGTFTTVGAYGISSVTMLSLNRLRVDLKTPIRSSDLSKLVDVSTWFVRPIPGNYTHDDNNTVVVKEVYAENTHNPQFVILRTSKMIENQRYEVLSTGAFSDLSGNAFDGSELIAAEARLTKLDAMMDGLPPMWTADQSTIPFWTLSAIANSDDEIGGNQGLFITDPLSRNI